MSKVKFLYEFRSKFQTPKFQEICLIMEFLKLRSTSKEADCAARNGQLEVLKWLQSQGILPSSRGADLASKNGHLEVLKWLHSQGVLPTSEGADLAARNDRLEVLKWLQSQEIHSSP
jgi:hypothetical protein